MRRSWELFWFSELSIKQNWSDAYRDCFLPPVTTACSVNERWQCLTIHYCKRPAFTFNHLVDVVIQSDLQMSKLTSNLLYRSHCNISKVNQSSTKARAEKCWQGGKQLSLYYCYGYYVLSVCKWSVFSTIS